MWMRLVPVIALILLPAAAYADQTFRNRDFGYSLTLPDTWEQVPEEVLGPFREQHRHKEKADHPMVAFYQLAVNRYFHSPLILVNVGEYARPLYLTRYDYRDVVEHARKKRLEQSRHLRTEGAPFVEVEAFTAKQLIRETFDINDTERVSIYTYFGATRYWEFVLVYPVDNKNISVVRAALENLTVQRDTMRGIGALVRETYERAKSEYGIFFEAASSLRVVFVGGGTVLFLLALGAGFLWRERRKRGKQDEG